MIFSGPRNNITASVQEALTTGFLAEVTHWGRYFFTIYLSISEEIGIDLMVAKNFPRGFSFRK